MLSKNDKLWLEEMTALKIKEALTVKVRFEKRRDPGTGQPLAVPEVEVRDVYLPAHWVEFLPFYEASIRGVQETADRLKNSDTRQGQAVEAMAGILLSMQGGIQAIAEAAAGTSRIALKARNPAEIEYIEPENEIRGMRSL